jgi:6-phosphogluconolactonase
MLCLCVYKVPQRDDIGDIAIMTSGTPWSRRAFLRGVGYTSALGVLSGVSPGSKMPVQSSLNSIPKVGFAFVGSRGKEIGSPGDGSASGIHVFQVRSDDWSWKQTIPSRSPVCLALHPNEQFLYVANDVDEYERLPRGTVEAYKIDAHHGTLDLISRQPLSLSGSKPRHLGISPDGNYLVVTIHGGGAYNVLPIGSDGIVGRVTQIFKEVGAGPHPIYQASAHPHTAMFDATGQHLLATDEGCDRISVFRFQNGWITRTFQASSQPLSGPGYLAMHPAGNFLYVSNTLDGSIDCYRWHADIGQMEHQRRVVTNRKTGERGAHQLVISSSGRFLYAASANEGISVWEIDPMTGKLSLIQQWILTNRSLRPLILSLDSRRLFVADSRQRQLLSILVHAGSGELGTAVAVAKMATPGSLVVRYL